VEWYTPAGLVDQLGHFDLDPACGDPTRCHVDARMHWSVDGDVRPYFGRTWLNPPYGPRGVPFIESMIEHRRGLLLLPARTETRIFQQAAEAADAVCFLRERLWFERNDGFTGRSSFGSVLFAYRDSIPEHLGWSVGTREGEAG